MSSGFAGEVFSPSAFLDIAYSPKPASHHSVPARGIKLKRNRQRVDAGQPRNSYARNASPASVSAMSSPFAFAPAAAHSPVASLFGPSHGAVNAFFRLHQQQQQALLSAASAAATDDSGKPQPAATPTAAAAAAEDKARTPGAEHNGNDARGCGTCEDGDGEGVAAKRSRVETIVSGIHSAPSSPGAPHADTSGSADVAEDGPRTHSAAGSDPSPRSKRKSYQPQKEVNGDGAAEERAAPSPDDSANAGEERKPEPPVGDRVQQLLEIQRRQYMEWLSNQQQKAKEAGAGKEAEAEQAEDLRQGIAKSAGQKDLISLAASLKSEITAQLSLTIDRILKEYSDKETARFAAQMRALEASRSQQAASAAAARASNPYASFLGPYYGAALGAYSGAFPHFPNSSTAAAAAAAAANASIFPGAAASFGASPSNMAGSPFSAAAAAAANDSALRKDPFSFFSSKRKRSKVCPPYFPSLPFLPFQLGL